jgi:hypothetical protein
MAHAERRLPAVADENDAGEAANSPLSSYSTTVTSRTSIPARNAATGSVVPRVRFAPEPERQRRERTCSSCGWLGPTAARRVKNEEDGDRRSKVGRRGR